MHSNSLTRGSIPAPIQIMQSNSEPERPSTNYPSTRLPSIREMNLLESTRPHTSTLLNLTETSLNYHQPMINMRRLSVPNSMIPQRTGCDPIRGRPTINKTGSKPRTKTVSKSKQFKPNFNQGLFNVMHNPAIFLNEQHQTGPWSHQNSVPGNLLPNLDPAPLSAPIRVNGFHLKSITNSSNLPPPSSPIDSPPSRHNSDPLSLNDSKISHRRKEQQRRDSFSLGMKLLDDKLDQLLGVNPLPKRKKLDTINLAYKKLSQQAIEIENLKHQLTMFQSNLFNNN